jgi:hypothetical protein
LLRNIVWNLDKNSDDRGKYNPSVEIGGRKHGNNKIKSRDAG